MSRSAAVLFFLTLALLLGGCTYPIQTTTEVDVSAGFDPDDPHWAVKQDAESPSGGVSAGVDMFTGQDTPGIGPQAWFKDDNSNPGAKPYVVRFSVAQPSRGRTPDDNIYDCVATIISTVQGNAITRKISVGQGVAIEGEAESVNVTIDDITPDFGQSVVQPDGTIGTFNNPYRVVVFIAPGVRPNYTIPPTLEAFTSTVAGVPDVTSGTITLANNQTAVYPIPPDAGVSSVEVVAVTLASPGHAGVNVAAGNASLTIFSKFYDATQVEGFVSLPANANAVSVTNTTGNPTDITVTWGIEG